MPYKLNIGCGSDKREGYINIDIREEVKPDLVLNIEREKLPFADSSVEEIIAYDVVEHISFRRVEYVIKEFNRVMCFRGKLKIRVPDLERLAKKLLSEEWDFWQIGYWFYGAQDYPENTHRSGFTLQAITSLLKKHGFEVERAEWDNSNLIILARKIRQMEEADREEAEELAEETRRRRYEREREGR